MNLRGPVFLVQEAIPHLAASPGGAVINVISAGAFMFSGGLGLYTGAKAALLGWTRVMAAELRLPGHQGQRAGPRNGRHGHGSQQSA